MKTYKKQIITVIMVLLLAATCLFSGCKTETAPAVADDDAITGTKETEEENVKQEVSIVMVGDVLLHQPIEDSALQADGSYDFTQLFTNTKDVISSADLAIANQEVILGGTELGISGYPTFNAPFEVGDALVDAGFDVVLHATNHALDRHGKGILNALQFWQEKYPQIGVLGIHASEEDSQEVYITEINGIKIAILNYTYGTNGIPLPEDMPYAVDYLEETKVIEDIRQAEENADFTIVCPHWGTEYELGISGMQESWTKLFAENGVDLVLGTHPHVIEPIEWITTEDGHEMLVYYSLGNYVNQTASSGAGIAKRAVGGMAEVTIALDENGTAQITDYGVEALISHMSDKTTTYFLKDYTRDLAATNYMTQKDPEFSLEYCKELCRKVWDVVE